jgi:hypothetical protein
LMTGEDMQQTSGTSLGKGELARLTAASLTAAGLQVVMPDTADPDGFLRLSITCHGAQCALMVTDDAAELWWTPHAGEAADPHRTADLAAALLSGEAGVRHPDTVGGRDITFKGIVGMDLRAAGFTVDLNTYPDDYYYDVIAEIAANNPRTADSGTVYVTDDGGLTWHRDYWEEHAETLWKPHFSTWLPDPPAVARAIAGTVSRALSVSDAMPAAR